MKWNIFMLIMPIRGLINISTDSIPRTDYNFSHEIFIILFYSIRFFCEYRNILNSSFFSSIIYDPSNTFLSYSFFPCVYIGICSSPCLLPGDTQFKTFLLQVVSSHSIICSNHLWWISPIFWIAFRFSLFSLIRCFFFILAYLEIHIQSLW